jgi:hypothetical protein
MLVGALPPQLQPPCPYSPVRVCAIVAARLDTRHTPQRQAASDFTRADGPPSGFWGRREEREGRRAPVGHAQCARGEERDSRKRKRRARPPAQSKANSVQHRAAKRQAAFSVLGFGLFAPLPLGPGPWLLALVPRAVFTPPKPSSASLNQVPSLYIVHCLLSP